MLRHRSLDCADSVRTVIWKENDERPEASRDNYTWTDGDPRIHMRRVIKIDYLLWSSGTLHFLIKTFREENMVINFVLESNWNQVATPADICDYNYDMFYFYLQDAKR